VCRDKIGLDRKYTCVRCSKGIESLDTPIKKIIGKGVCHLCKKLTDVFDANKMKTWERVCVCKDCIIKEGDKCENTKI